MNSETIPAQRALYGRRRCRREGTTLPPVGAVGRPTALPSTPGGHYHFGRVTAPSAAEVTEAAYLAITPRR